MKSLSTTLLLASVITITQAHAAAPRMPIDFIGEWCNPTKQDNGETNYTLPSWSEDHKCDGIMSIDQYGFAFDLGADKETYCDPQSVRQGHETAPSGTTYLATIAATCYIGTTPGKKSNRTFEFSRYKGNIYVKPK